jgi:signal transduction histidine kinase
LADTDYVITIYPVKSFHDDFITSNPENSCVIVVLLIAFTTFLVLVNCHLARSREKELTESAKHSFAGAAAREAVLLAKKVYVRYISHEIRTPLNAAYLGLKVLEKEIAKRKGPFHAEQLCIIRDVVNACDIAVSILNDLLNYDKLEDGTLMIEPKKVLALPFVISAISLFLLQAEEKGVRVVFDMDMDFSDNNNNNNNATSSTDLQDSEHNHPSHPHCTASYLGKNDYINVDEHKMSQVIRNLVSNAIKVRLLHMCSVCRDAGCHNLRHCM